MVIRPLGNTLSYFSPIYSYSLRASRRVCSQVYFYYHADLDQVYLWMLQFALVLFSIPYYFNYKFIVELIQQCFSALYLSLQAIKPFLVYARLINHLLFILCIHGTPVSIRAAKLFVYLVSLIQLL